MPETSQRSLAGRYTLIRALGQGAMGRVWLARDEMLRRDVAVKELVPPPGLSESETAQLRERSLREARAIAQLSHSNAVRIFDILIDGGDPWIVMEFIPSQPLHSVLRAEGPMSPARAARIGLAVLSALSAAHRVGVLHRDVKPANVLLGTDGRIMLTDFGLATVEDDPAMTRTGIVLGSPAYLAPERAIGEQAGSAADLWSLGATLYATVEGRSPYARSSSIATLAALATELPAPPQRAGALFPVLEGLLRKDPARRITAAEAEKLLQQAAGSGEEMSAPPAQTAPAQLPAPVVPRQRRTEHAGSAGVAPPASPAAGGGPLDARFGYRGPDASASTPIVTPKASAIPGVEGSFGFSASGSSATPTARPRTTPPRSANGLLDQLLGPNGRPMRLAVMVLVPLLVLLVVLLLVVPLLSAGEDNSGPDRDPAVGAPVNAGRSETPGPSGSPSTPPPTADGGGAGLPRPESSKAPAPPAGETSATRPATSTTGVPQPAPVFTGRPIVSYGSGRCVDVPDSDASTVRAIQMWECNGNPGQTFELTGFGQLRTLGRCLEVSGSQDGAAIRLADCDGAWDQIFALNTVGDLVNESVDKCVDVMDSNMGDGAQLQLWECNGGSHQKWYAG